MEAQGAPALRILRDHEWFARWCVRRVIGGEFRRDGMEHWDDAVQVARVAIWRVIPAWLAAGRAKFSSFARVPVTRDVRHFLRLQVRQGFVRTGDYKGRPARPPRRCPLAPRPAPAADPDTRLDAELVWRVAATLRPRHRAVLAAIYRGGLLRTEAAVQLGLSKSCVLRAERAALRQLRAALA